MTEILITLAIGLIAGLAGMLLWWALLSDWWHAGSKKRRCPKCAYDMTGASGLKCPECGTVAKSEHGLHRSRRRWRLAILALLMLACASSGPIWMQVSRLGWRSLFSLEQIAFIQAVRGEWEYPPLSQNSMGFTSYVAGPQIREAGAIFFGSDHRDEAKASSFWLRRAIRWHIPAASLTDGDFIRAVSTITQNDPTLGPDSVERTYLRNAEAALQQQTTANTVAAAQRSFKDDVVVKGDAAVWVAWRDDPEWRLLATQHLMAKRPAMSITEQEAAESLFSDESRGPALGLMATLGRFDVLDRYWQLVVASDKDGSAVRAAFELLPHTGGASAGELRTRVGTFALSAIGTDSRRLGDIARLAALYPPAEPVFIDHFESVSDDAIIRGVLPTMLDLHPASNSVRVFRSLARRWALCGRCDNLTRLLVCCNLSQSDALEILQGGESHERSAALQLLERRHHWLAGPEFDPLRPVVRRLTFDATLSIEDRLNAVTVLRDRTPEGARLRPGATE